MPTTRPLRLAAVLVLAAGLLAGCGDDEAAEPAGDATTTTAATEATIPAGATVADLTGADPAISVIDNSFEPRYARVTAGATITFTNNGDVKHNVTPVVDGAFTPIDDADFGPGATGTIVVAEAGVVAYYCTIHGTPRNGQTGAFEVVAG